MSDFTPWTGLGGGIAIGLSASLLLLGAGRVAGVSGITAGAFSRAAAERDWRVAFLAGLVLSGLGFAVFAPAAISASPRPLAWLALAGLLVGVGTRLGGGCTSGHGVCGTSRLSRRSLTATGLFVATGMLHGHVAACPRGHAMTPARRLVVLALGAGVLFGVGLGVSGMTRPEKVLGFLDVTGDWDPTLLCVMGGAVAAHVWAYRAIRGRAAPPLAERYFVPASSPIDARLGLGAVLFGVGWGLGGYCPGPAIVSLATGSARVLVFVAAMLAGMWLVRPALGERHPNSAETLLGAPSVPASRRTS